MQSWTYFLAAVALTVSCCLSAAHAEQIDDRNLKFSLIIPDGFVRDSQLAGAQPDFVYAFRKTEPPEIGVVIIIERMRGTIGRERLDASKMPRGFTGKVLSVRWHDFDLDALEVPEEVSGVATVNYNVQVPLKPEAIQIRVVGRRDRKDQLLQLTNNLLRDLQGESNWLRSSAPPALAQSSNYGSLILAVCGIGIIAGLIVLWLVRRVSRRGTVLGLAVLIYAVSWLIAPGETREMRATVGAVRMLGFLGFLLGLFDLFRHPAAKRAAEESPAAVDRPGV
jgi:hypothetical protein